MITDELETELRRAFARTAQGISLPAQARERLLQREYHPRTGARRRAATLAAAVAVVVAVATGWAVVPLTGTGPAGLPSAAAVGKAMLGALPAVRGDIVYEKQIGLHRGTVVVESRLWIWPAQPAPGQQVRLRNIYAQWIPPAANAQRILPSAYGQPVPASAKALTLIDDTGLAYKYPPRSFWHGFTRLTNGTLRLTQVCYLRTGRCGGGEGPTLARTWSKASFQDFLPIGSGIAPGDTLNPATIAREILTGQWRVVRHAQMDGQPAIELRGSSPDFFGPCPEPVPPSPLVNNPCQVRASLLWVNARTHLPLRWIGVEGTSVVAQEDYAYLPPTPANRALLRVPIPRGYPRSQESEPGAPGY